MENLLTNFSISQILIFIVFLAVAIKGIVEFFEWAIPRLRKAFNKENQEEDEKEELQQRLDKGSHTMHELARNQEELSEELIQLTDRINMLIDSDKDSIKSFLTKEHHYFCYQKRWIDDYSLECCERRYSHYKDEGGNSFIGGFMEDLRALPNQPPYDSPDLTK